MSSNASFCLSVGHPTRHKGAVMKSPRRGMAQGGGGGRQSSRSSSSSFLCPVCIPRFGEAGGRAGSGHSQMMSALRSAMRSAAVMMHLVLS